MKTHDNWHKATASGHTGACVELRAVDGQQIRDSKYPAKASPILTGGVHALVHHIKTRH